MKKIKLLIFLLIFSSCGIDKESPPPLSSINNLGVLDLTFFSTGFYTLDGSAGGSGHDEINDMVMDQQGRILAVGSSVNASGNLDMTIWRLTASGTLDTSFSGDGIYSHDNAAGGSGDDIGYSIVTDSSNNIYVTGTSLNGSGNFDMVVWKITSSGAIDSSFNGTGLFAHDNAAGGNLNDQGNKIKINSSQKILIVGYSDQSLTNRDLAIWKLNTNGTLDTSFDTDGVLTYDGAAGGEDDIGNSFDFDSNGNIIVAGSGESGSDLSDTVVWKFDSSGSLDTSFNGTGIFVHHNAAGGNDQDGGKDIVVDHTGQYIVSGFSRNTHGNYDMVLWKIASDGTLNNDFGNNGLVIFDSSTLAGTPSNDFGNSLFIDGSRNLLVAGESNQSMSIWRLNEDGSLDDSFNTDGYFSHDSAAGGFGVDAGNSVLIDIFERVYIGGFSENSSGNFDATFWRMK